MSSESFKNKVYVPPYSRLERKLDEYRQEVAESDLNDALVLTLAKKEQIRRAELTPVVGNASTSTQGTTNDEVRQIVERLIGEKKG